MIEHDEAVKELKEKCERHSSHGKDGERAGYVQVGAKRSDGGRGL